MKKILLLIYDLFTKDMWLFKKIYFNIDSVRINNSCAEYIKPIKYDNRGKPYIKPYSFQLVYLEDRTDWNIKYLTCDKEDIIKELS